MSNHCDDDGKTFCSLLTGSNRTKLIRKITFSFSLFPICTTVHQNKAQTNGLVNYSHTNSAKPFVFCLWTFSISLCSQCQCPLSIFAYQTYFTKKVHRISSRELIDTFAYISQNRFFFLPSLVYCCLGEESSLSPHQPVVSFSCLFIQFFCKTFSPLSLSFSL